MEDFDFDSTYIYYSSKLSTSYVIFTIISKEGLGDDITYILFPLLVKGREGIMFNSFTKLSKVAQNTTLLYNKKLTVEQLYDLYPEYVI